MSGNSHQRRLERRHPTRPEKAPREETFRDVMWRAFKETPEYAHWVEFEAPRLLEDPLLGLFKVKKS